MDLGSSSSFCKLMRLWWKPARCNWGDYCGIHYSVATATMNLTRLVVGLETGAAQPGGCQLDAGGGDVAGGAADLR